MSRTLLLWFLLVPVTLLGVFVYRRSAQSSDHSIALMNAAETGDLDLVSSLIKGGARADSGDVELGETPLVIAIRNGHLEVADFLLRHGANINISGISGPTALFAALGTGRPEMVEF